MTKIRLLTAAALYDGHDVSINLFRRLLQNRGAEVIHLGHNRSVKEVVTVAVQEDVDAVLISSYQGGHNEYFKYVVDSLRELGARHVLVFGGGGGVILPSEIQALEEYGVCRLYHAVDGQKIGIDGISDDIIKRIIEYKENTPDRYFSQIDESILRDINTDSHLNIARQLSFFETFSGNGIDLKETRNNLKNYDKKKSLVLGVTGTGGSGKSSLIDEIIGRILSYTEDIKIGILAIDPSKSRTGGALLGDRIRYNHIYDPRIYFRSFATRQSESELSKAIEDSVEVLKAAGFDLIFVE
ncbi:MAG: isobutyryl-CoA mutase, partial [Bacteroidota bacterium]|nr:isobutyryl-CoA mutase [Bacteroidota bacterium]